MKETTQMKMFELLPSPLGSIFRKLTHFTCNSPTGNGIFFSPKGKRTFPQGHSSVPLCHPSPRKVLSWYRCGSHHIYRQTINVIRSDDMIAWSFSLRNHPLGQGLGIASTTNICARFMGTSNVPSAACRQRGPSSVSPGRKASGRRNRFTPSICARM